MNRETLIALSYRYHGEYFQIVNAIQKKEDIEPIDYKYCITILDKEYPRCFLDLKYPPLVLYYKGNIHLLENDNRIAIIGSRNPCQYAIDSTIQLTKANKDKIIVSGLAKGIDGIAHDHSMTSIGVLGCGIDFVYPKENMHLYKKLEKKGLILSEYPFHTKPLSFHFPFRNRIIAALSQIIYVMQSSQKSGTITTVNEALELQKEIKVLPYSLQEGYDLYNNYLIQEGAGLIQMDDLKIDK